MTQSEFTTINNGNLLKRLRRMRVLVLHPEDDEREMFLAHLKRIGCQVESLWPAPSSLPDQVDVVLFLVNKVYENIDHSWMASDTAIAKIAIITFETPEILTTLDRLNVHGILTKPIRLFGVLAALTTAISLVRHENRLKRRVRTLDETLKARRLIEKAVAILSKNKGISEQEAYKKIRDRSMQSQKSISSIASAIISTDEI